VAKIGQNQARVLGYLTYVRLITQKSVRDLLWFSSNLKAFLQGDMALDVVDMLALQPLPLFDSFGKDSASADGVSDSDSIPLSAAYSSCSPSSSAPSTSASSSSSLAASPVSSPDVAIGLAQPEPDFFLLDQTTITHSRRHDKQRRVQQTGPRYSQYAADIVKREAKALLELAQRLEGQADEEDYQPDSKHSVESFDRAVDLLNTMHTYGKVVITGIGKSGLLARKAVATFNSLGTANRNCSDIHILSFDLQAYRVRSCTHPKHCMGISDWSLLTAWTSSSSFRTLARRENYWTSLSSCEGAAVMRSYP
jgi:hypothetical protein